MLKKLMLAVVLLLVTQAANAGLISGFESGLNGWTYAGDVSAQKANIGLDPTQGSRQALLTTAIDPGLSFSGSGALPFPVDGFVTAFLGLPDDVYSPSYWN